MSISELKRKTEDYLMEFYPERYILGLFVSTRDIYEHRSLLKGIKFNDHVLGYLVDIILADIDQNRRFRKYDCLKVIRAIVRAKEPEQVIISQEVISRLFRIYKEYIFIENEKIQWCVSAILKNQILNDEDIQWLTFHYQESDHLVNRLLRYPDRNPRITVWAEQVYKSNALPDRLSEVIGLLIDEDIPSYVKERGSELIWAIYYSLIPDIVKQNLLRKYYSMETLETILTVSSRMNFPIVMEFILKELEKAVDIA